MKFADRVRILIAMGLVFIFVASMVMPPKPTSANAQAKTLAERPVLQTKEITPTKCDEFYEKAKEIMANGRTIYEQANAERSMAYSLMYQNCVARNGK